MCGDELEHHITPEDLLTNKMVVNLNVLGTTMKHRISGNGQSTDIITPEKRRMRKKKELQWLTSSKRCHIED